MGCLSIRLCLLHFILAKYCSFHCIDFYFLDYIYSSICYFDSSVNGIILFLFQKLHHYCIGMQLISPCWFRILPHYWNCWFQQFLTNYLGFSICKINKQWHFYFLLSNLNFFSLSCLILYLELPVQYGIRVMRMGIISLFLILEEMLSISLHWVLC